MKNKHGNLRCEGCGGYDIRMTVHYDGMDCESEAGEGSGFKCEVTLYCEDCGRVYPVCRVKKFSDISPLKVEVAERVKIYRAVTTQTQSVARAPCTATVAP